MAGIVLLGLVSARTDPADAAFGDPFSLEVVGSSYLTFDEPGPNWGPGVAFWTADRPPKHIMDLNFEPSTTIGDYTFAGTIRFEASPYESQGTQTCLTAQLVTGDVVNGTFSPRTGTLNATVTVRLQRYPTPRPGSSPKLAARCTGYPPGPYVFEYTMNLTGHWHQGEFKLWGGAIYFPGGRVINVSFTAPIP